MIVSGWSPVHGQVGTTSNLCAIALYIALTRKYNCIVLQTHFNLNPLENIMMGETDSVNDSLMDYGIDALLKISASRELTANDIKERSVTVIKDRLSLIPATGKSNECIYCSELSENGNLVKILNTMDKYYDIVFVDTNAGDGELASLVTERADYVLANLSQNRLVVEDFFKRYPVNHKLFFTLGVYDKGSRYNLNNLKKLQKNLKSSNTGVIPYNVEFKDAVSDCKLIRFLRKNLNATKDDPNFEFINSLRLCSETFLKFTGKGAK